MQRTRHGVKHLILVVALAAATIAGAAAPQADASNGDPISVHHFANNGAATLAQAAALGTNIGFFTILPMINPQPLPPSKGPPCLPCPMVQQG
jgi:hypothetical protein